MLNDPNDPLIQPEVIPLHAAAPDPIVLPDPSTVFGDRARRFDTFAARGDGQQAFFAFMAQLSRAQQAAATTFVPTAMPDAATLATRHAHHMPILPGGLSERDPSWVAALRAVIRASEDGGALPPAVVTARRTLEAASDDELDRLAGALLAFDYEAVPSDAVPWLAAGLQTYWVVAVAALGRDAARSIDVGGVCPCCGSLPVASLRRIGGIQQGLRFLVCSLCATQWHLVRVKCSHCESTAGIGYLTLSTDPDSEVGKAAATREVVKAEVCDQCSSYLKLVSLEADANADPVADDLATLALDILTDERGYARIGPNLFIHPGVALA
jgi:FdhE protein